MNKNYNQNQNKNQLIKKYCKVCHDAGKPESEYTNHYVKSVPGPKGIIVCPTLLQTECRYCFHPGHTAKFCPKLAEKNKVGNYETSSEKVEKVEKNKKNEKKVKKEVVKSSYKGNIFSALQDDDEDDETENKKQVVKKVEEYPQLPSKVQVQRQSQVVSKMSFTDALKKTTTQVANEKEERAKELGKGLTVLQLSTKPKEPKVALANNQEFTFVDAKPKMIIRRSWADYTDDEDDDSEDETEAKVMTAW